MDILEEKKSDHSKPRESVIELKAKKRCHKLEKPHHYTSDTIFLFNYKDAEDISETFQSDISEGKMSLFFPQFFQFAHLTVNLYSLIFLE